MDYYARSPYAYASHEDLHVSLTSVILHGNAFTKKISLRTGPSFHIVSSTFHCISEASQFSVIFSIS